MNFWKNHMDFSKKTIWIVWLSHNFENCPSMIFPSKLLEPAEQSMVSPSSSEEKMLSQVLFWRTIHVAEVPNSCKILLYWLLRSKIWYFRVIWLFIAKFFYKNGIFLCFLEGRGKKSKQNDTAGFSSSWILFSRMRQCVS